MEQVKATRGPSETLHDDPAALRSPEPTPTQTYVDLQMNIGLMKGSSLPEAEDIIPIVESIDEATVHLIADEASYAAGASGRVACIGCPGIYVSLKEAHPEHKVDDLFIDFDPRFRVSMVIGLQVCFKYLDVFLSNFLCASRAFARIH